MAASLTELTAISFNTSNVLCGGLSLKDVNSARQRTMLPLEFLGDVVLKCRDLKASIAEPLLVDLPSDINRSRHTKSAEGAIFRTLCKPRRQHRLSFSEIAVPIRPHLGEFSFVIDLKSRRHG